MLRMQSATRWVVPLVLVAACAATGFSREAQPGGEEDEMAELRKQLQENAIVSTGALKAMLDARTPVVILDARTGKYDDGRRLPGAKALAPEAGEQEMAAAIPSKDALIVTYCTNPACPASGELAKNLKQQGYRNVIKFPEGIQGWMMAGFEVVTTEGAKTGKGSGEE